MTDARTIKYLKTALRVVFAGFVFWVFLRYAFFWLLPFFIAFLMAYLFERPIRALSSRHRINRRFSSAALTLLLYGALAIALYLAVYRIGTELPRLISWLGRVTARAPAIVDDLRVRLLGFIAGLPLPLQNLVNSLNIGDMIGELALPQDALTRLVSFGTGIAKALPSMFMFMVACTLSTYFISADYPHVTGFITRQTPEKWRFKLQRTWAHLKNTLGKWLRAQLMLMGMTFVELSVGLCILGTPYFMVIALLVAALDALPVFGTGAVLLPWAVVAFISGDSSRALGLLIMWMVISAARSIVEPRLVGGQIGLHPLVTMISIYIGFKTIGIIGMVLFPVAALTLIKFQEWGYVAIWKDADAG